MVAMMDTLFDTDTPVIDMSRLTMRITNKTTADNWTAKYHYSGTSGTGNAIYWAAFAPDLIGVVSIGHTSNASGVAAKYGLQDIPGNIEITRVAVHPTAPKNTASRIIRMACREHHRHTGLEWLFSYADTGQGHHGGIYQALNAVYVGVSSFEPYGYVLDGTPIHARSLVARYGTRSWPRVQLLAEAEGKSLERVAGMLAVKHTYILPIGDRRSERRVRNAVARYARPYPKR